MKLYTKTVCPKCIFVKSEIERLGATDRVEVINTDQHTEVREMLIEKGIMAAPVLEVNEIFFTEPGDIVEAIEEEMQ